MKYLLENLCVKTLERGETPVRIVLCEDCPYDLIKCSFVISSKFLLKTTCLLHKARGCPTGFRAAFAAVFVLIYWLSAASR